MKEEQCKKLKLKLKVLTLYIYAVQVSLGGSELSEGETGDAMGGESEEDDFEIQMDHLDSDYDESDQNGVTERLKKEGQGAHSCLDKIVKCTIFFNSVQNFTIVYTIWMYRLVVKLPPLIK